MNKNLIWFGPVFSYSGFALHNRSIIFELLKLGWNISLYPTEQGIPELLIGKETLIKLTQNFSVKRENSICINLIPPTALPFYAKYTILSTTLESKTVHPGYYSRLSLFDEVWVPCKANYRSVRTAGFPLDKLFYFPEGVYPELWKPSSDKHPKYKSDLFTFFYNGDWSFRKGTDSIVKCFLEAFSYTDNVRLLLLVHYQGSAPFHSERTIMSEFYNYLRKNNLTKIPRIEFIFDYIEDPELPSIFACADVYVAPTRGEAWGLPIIQAMSCGLPPIVTSWGGQMDYCNRHNSFLIKLDKFDIMDDKVNLCVDFYKKQLFPFPSEKHLTKLYRYAYDHQNICKKKGTIARNYVSKNFHWSLTAKRISQRLEEIYESRYFFDNLQPRRMVKGIFANVL